MEKPEALHIFEPRLVGDVYGSSRPIHFHLIHLFYITLRISLSVSLHYQYCVRLFQGRLHMGQSQPEFWHPVQHQPGKARCHEKGEGRQDGLEETEPVASDCQLLICPLIEDVWLQDPLFHVPQLQDSHSIVIEVWRCLAVLTWNLNEVLLKNGADKKGVTSQTSKLFLRQTAVAQLQKITLQNHGLLAWKKVKNTKHTPSPQAMVNSKKQSTYKLFDAQAWLINQKVALLVVLRGAFLGGIGILVLNQFWYFLKMKVSFLLSWFFKQS